MLLPSPSTFVSQHSFHSVFILPFLFRIPYMSHPSSLSPCHPFLFRILCSVWFSRLPFPSQPACFTPSLPACLVSFPYPTLSIRALRAFRGGCYCGVTGHLPLITFPLMRLLVPYYHRSSSWPSLGYHSRYSTLLSHPSFLFPASLIFRVTSSLIICSSHFL